MHNKFKMYRLSVDGVFLKKRQLTLESACAWAEIALSSGAGVVKIWYNDTDLIKTLERK